MKTIILNEKQLFSSGRYGLYFRVSQRNGIKIIKGSGVKKLPNLASAKNQKVIQEATIGVLAKSPTKKLVLVKYKGLYYVGIFQTHVRTVKSKANFSVEKIKSSLKKKKVVHSDIYVNNVLSTKKGFVLIDFDPDHSYFVGEKTVYYSVKNKLVKELKAQMV